MALRLLGSVLITLGVFTIGYSRPTQNCSASQPTPAGSATSRGGWLILSALMMVAMLGWGSKAVFDKLAVDASSAVIAFEWLVLWGALLSILTWIILYFQGNRPPMLQGRLWVYPTLSALCLMLGNLCFLGALSISTASYVIIITACYPLLMYVFAVFLLNEKVNLTRLAGIAIIVVGGILTQATQFA